MESRGWQANRDSYAASFGRQWNRYDVVRPEEDEATFLVKTGVAPGEPRRPTRARRRMRRRALRPTRRVSRCKGHRRRLERGRPESRPALRLTPQCCHHPGRPSRPSAGRFRLRPRLLDRCLAPYAKPAPGVRGNRPQSQAGGPAGGVALSPQCRSFRNGSIPAFAASPPGCLPGSSSRFARAWVRSEAFPILNRTLNKIANFSSHPDWTLTSLRQF